MNKRVILFGSAFILSILSVSLVAAQALPAPPISMNDISGFFTGLLSGSQSSFWTSSLLLAILLTVVLYKPAEKLTGNSSGLGLTVSIIVSVLAVRFLTPEEVIGIMLPYSALGIAVWVLIPFMLFAYFIITSDIPKLLRNVGWFLLIMIFTVLWISRWDQIGDMAWIYLLGSALTLIVAIFDGTLHRWYYQGKISRKSSVAAGIQANILSDEIKGLYGDLAKSSTDAQRTELKKQITEKEKAIKSLLTEESKG